MIFLDTYALVEMTKGDQSYQSIMDVQWCTFTLNLAEYFYAFLKEGNGDVAERNFAVLAAHVVDIPPATVLEAMRFRFERRKSSLSYADAIGYSYARSKSIPFVTGDQAFRSLPGVTFIGGKDKR